MNGSVTSLRSSDAARQLGVSIKALRLYERHGLVTPRRSAAGYRAYSADDMMRGAKVVMLRTLGLSLAEVASVLNGDPPGLRAALASHETLLDTQIHELVGKLDKVRALQADLARGQMPHDGQLTKLLNRTQPSVAFELPWPWAGEWFELRDIRPLNYVIGSLGSGKTRLALRLAESLPGAMFLGLSRLEEASPVAMALTRADGDLRSRVDQALAWLVGEGGTKSDALIALLIALEAPSAAALVIDMIEQDLDQRTQESLIAFLRHRARIDDRPVFMLTRSSAILDLAAVGPDEAIILCPANHSPPVRVAPYPGAAGYEAMATCLATPEVRARIARCPMSA